MILSNYWRAMRVLENVAGSGMTSADLGIKDITGAALGNIDMADDGMNGSFREGAIANARLRTANITIRLGKGTGDITAADYALADDCTANISNLLFSSSFNAGDDGYSQVIIITGTNNTANDITLTEVGVCKKFQRFIDSNSNRPQSNEVMLAKLHLDKPIKVLANGSFRIIVEWVEQ